MNQRVCPHCRTRRHFGSSPYGATCLGCGFTDSRSLDSDGRVRDMIVQRAIAIVVLVSLMVLLEVVWSRL